MRDETINMTYLLQDIDNQYVAIGNLIFENHTFTTNLLI